MLHEDECMLSQIRKTIPRSQPKQQRRPQTYGISSNWNYSRKFDDAKNNKIINYLKRINNFKSDYHHSIEIIDDFKDNIFVKSTDSANNFRNTFCAISNHCMPFLLFFEMIRYSAWDYSAQASHQLSTITKKTTWHKKNENKKIFFITKVFHFSFLLIFVWKLIGYYDNTRWLWASDKNFSSNKQALQKIKVYYYFQDLLR